MILCMLAAMAAAVLVRLPAARLSGMPEEYRDVFQNEEGIPYLTDPDSYYHARITDRRLEDGVLSGRSADGDRLWDTQSFYPEGRSTDDQPGIAWMTAAVWRAARLFSDTGRYAAEFYLPAVMAALTALAAFLLGYRMSGIPGGFTAGVLTACGAAFTGRTLPGRFDTDMFTVLMGVLLVFFLTETLRAHTGKTRVLAAAGFSLTVLAYSLCWSVYALVFAALTLAGGVLFLLILLPVSRSGTDPGQVSVKEAGTGLLLCAAIPVLLLLLVQGPSFFSRFVSQTSALHTLAENGSRNASGILPDLYASINELDAPQFLSAAPSEWFPAYIPGKMLTVVGGVGGGVVYLLCVCALTILAVQAVRRRKGAETEEYENEGSAGTSAGNDGKTWFSLNRCESILYLCVLGVWLAGGLYASGGGIRFVEHLSVPAGALGGACIGFLVPVPAEGKEEKQTVRTGRILLSLGLCAAAVILPLQGASGISRDNRPSVSDASQEAMDWIRENAEDPEAVIASWWDMGYYYEYASGHPALWDGGSQSAVRAVLVGRALTSRDPELSAAILRMLSASGNRAAEALIGYLGEKQAFSAMWETLPEDREETCRKLVHEYGLTEAEAEETECLLHPGEEKETYLIITDLMLNQLGWIEYFGNWDFSGTAVQPRATLYSLTPDGTAGMDSEDEKVRAFFNARTQETIWRLFFSGDGGQTFSKVFESADAAGHVQVWRAGQE